MKLKKLLFAALTLCSTAAMAAPSWIDWTTTSAGTLTLGSSNIAVTRIGSSPLDLVNGDYYYNNTSTGGTAGTYGGFMPSDVLRVDGASTFTINFTEAVLNPYIALVSVGRTYAPVSYTFSSAPTVLSWGNNYWGYGGYSVSGNVFTGREFNGVLQLAGTFSSLTFSTAPGEYWHGFNIGTDALASAVPEPESFALMMAGLGILGFAARRRKQERLA